MRVKASYELQPNALSRKSSMTGYHKTIVSVFLIRRHIVKKQCIFSWPLRSCCTEDLGGTTCTCSGIAFPHFFGCYVYLVHHFVLRSSRTECKQNSIQHAASVEEIRSIYYHGSTISRKRWKILDVFPGGEAQGVLPAPASSCRKFRTRAVPHIMITRMFHECLFPR